MKLYSPDITKPTEVNYYWHEKVLVEPMPKPKQDEWIPCSERLPKRDGNYLVTFHHKWPDREYKTVEVEEFRSGKFDENLYMKVVAWTPLPEPWKGAEVE